MSKDKGKAKYILRLSLKISVISLLLALLTIAGLLIWLRTESAERFLTGRAAKILAGQGLILESGRLSGPLPSRITISNLGLSDSQGLFLKIEALEAELGLRALLSGTLEVRRVHLTGADLIRRPQPPTSEQPARESGGFNFPLNIRLKSLLLENNVIRAGALNPGWAGDSARDLHLRAQGWAYLEGRRLGGQLEAALLSPGQEGLRLTIDLEPGAQAEGLNGSSGPEKLTLNLTASESAEGWLAVLNGRPDWPAYKVTLTGEGPLTDWRGRLDITAGPEGEVFKVGADLAWQGLSGELWRDAVTAPGFKAGLKARLTAGPKAPAGWPELAGEQLTASLALEQAERRLTGQLQLEAAPWNFKAADLSWQAAPAGGRELGLSLTGQIRDFTSFLTALGRPAPMAGGARSLSLTGRLQAALNNDFKKLTLKGNLEAQPENQVSPPWPLAFELALTDKPERLQVDSLFLAGLGLRVQAAGRYLKNLQGLTANLTASLTPGGPWRELAAQISGQERDGFFDGQLGLELDVDWPELAGPAQGNLRLRGRDLKWPWPGLRPWAGSELSLAAQLSGGGKRPYSLTIKRAEAGLLSLTGQADFVPDETGSPALAFENGRFQVTAQAALADLAPVTEGWSGPLELSLEAQGPLNGLNAFLRLTSPALKMPSGALRNLDTSLKTDLSRTGAADFKASGNLLAHAETVPGGPARASFGWELARAGDNYEAALKELVVDGGGLKLAADLAGRLNGSAGLKTSRLAGQLNLAVQDWSFLAAALGQPLTGRPAQLLSDFAHEDNRQHVSLNWNVPELKLQGGAGQPDTLALRGLSGRFAARDIFQKPALEFDMASGPGGAGPLGWSSGTAALKGVGDNGDLRALFRQAHNNQDLLALQGRYSLSEPALTLNRLNFNWPGSESGLSLEKPVILAFSEGFEIKGLRAALRPGGQLTAEAAFKEGQTQIKAAGQDLPLSFFQAFTGAALPEGAVSKATLNLDGGPGRANGDLALAVTVAGPARNRRGNGQSAVTFNLSGRLTDSALQGSGQLSLGTRGRESGELTYRLPLVISDGGWPRPDFNGPLNVNFKWRGALERIWRMLPLPDRNLSGQGEIELALKGSLNKIEPDVNLYIAGGRYEDLVIGLLLDDISLEAQRANDGSIRALLSARDAYEGRASLEGYLRPGQAAQAPFNLALRGQFTHLQPFQRDDLSLQLSGILGANGPLTAPAVNGRLVVEQGEFSLLNFMGGGSVRTLPISQKDGPSQAPAATDGPSWDVDITIPRQFYMRGRGLDSEWRGNLKIQGPLSGPVLTGFIKPVRGYFELLAKEFSITSGDIRFLGGPRVNPALQLEMTYTGPHITALVLVEGTASRPKLTLTSRPPHPQDEVLAQVLFNKNASELSRFEALQLANGLRELTGMSSGEFNPLTTTRETLGLDVLKIGSARGESPASRASDLSGSRDLPEGLRATANEAEDDIGGATIEAGKYLGDNVYVGLEQGLGAGGTGVRVEVELRPNLSLEGRTSTDSSQIGLGWKKDY